MGVTVTNLRFAYGARTVLQGISFEAPGGCLTSVLGPNGAGKSTLFKCLLGLIRTYAGEVRADGEDVRALPPRALARKIAYIPQSSYPAFNYAVRDMVLMGASARAGAFSAPGKAEETAALEALERLGLGDLKDRDYFRLSGGERQLVLIARALAQRSRILVLDEPTANLDYGNQLVVMSRLKALAGEGYTILQSTHNPEQAYLFSDRLLALKDGALIARGAPRDLMDAALIEALYGVKTSVESLRDDRVRVCVPQEIIS